MLTKEYCWPSRPVAQSRNHSRAVSCHLTHRVNLEQQCQNHSTVSTMATVSQQRLRGRPARKSHENSSNSKADGNKDTPGPTYLAYTPDGKRLVTAGSNNAIRVYTTGSDGEPVNVDDCQESNSAVVASVRIQWLVLHAGVVLTSCLPGRLLR